MECSLEGDQIETRIAEWTSLRAKARSVVLETGEGGQPSSSVVMRFATADESQVRALAEAESVCCAFLIIDVTRTTPSDRGAGDDAEIELRIASQDSGGDYVIEVLAGRAKAQAPTPIALTPKP